MANRIKGITVAINGDTTKLQTALKQVNTNIRNTQSQLKDVERLLRLDPTNTELLAQKQRLLKQAVSDTKDKLTTLKKASEDAAKTKDKYDAWKNCDGKTQEMAETMQDNLSGQFTILKSQLQELAISFGEVLLPKIKKLVSWLQGVVDKLNKLSPQARSMIAVVSLIVASMSIVALFCESKTRSFLAISVSLALLKFTY